jgi:hypothetical protein
LGVKPLQSIAPL